MAPENYGNEKLGSWLDAAMPLDAGLLTTAPEVKTIVEKLFIDIIRSIQADQKLKSTKAEKSLHRIKQTCKILLLNLYVAYLQGLPVRYSRDKNRYGTNKRYGQLFFKYSRVMAAVRALDSLGLVAQKPWVNDREKGIGRQSRIWATPELIHFFYHFDIHQPQRVAQEKRAELIELRDDDKNPIGYANTAHTHRMRENLLAYNDFIDKQEILVEIGDSQEISLNQLKKTIYSNCLSGELSLVRLGVYRYRVLNNYYEYKEPVVKNKE